VEDDPGLCDAVVRLARGFGADVSQAQRLDDAFRLLAEGPDLLIADLRIEDQSAFPLIEAAVGRRPAPAVVAMSGQASVEESFRLGRLGVRAYLAKPFGSDALLAAVERAERAPAEVAPRVSAEADGPAGDDVQQPPPRRGPRGFLGRLRRLLQRG
jgi:two-component system response regulator RegA